MRICLRLEILGLHGIRACGLPELPRAGVQLLDGRGGGAGCLPCLAEHVGGGDELGEILVALLFEEAEVDVGCILGVG